MNKLQAKWARKLVEAQQSYYDDAMGGGHGGSYFSNIYLLEDLLDDLGVTKDQLKAMHKKDCWLINNKMMCNCGI